MFRNRFGWLVAWCLLGAIAACGGEDASTGGGSEGDGTVRPRRIDDILYNPGIGVEMWHRAEWARTPPSYPEVRLTYYRWYWHQIEQEEGQIRWDIFDRALDDAVSTGARMGFRLMTVGGSNTGTYRGRTGRMAVPEWFAEKAGGSWYGDVFWPAYNSPAFMAEVERLMAALGRRYAGHPGLNHLDTSFFGCWGEQNDACIDGSVAPEDWWTPETYRRAIDIQFAAFPDLPILQLGTDDPDIGDYVHFTKGAGWRVDCFGDYGYFGPNWNHMEDFYPRILARYGDAWKRGMVSFEICGVLQDWVDKGFDFDLIMDKALEWHASSINLKAGNVPAAWMPKLLETLKRLGYRLRIEELQHPPQVRQGTSMNLRVVWANDGVAPPYHEYIPAAQLVSSNGERHTFEVEAVDVRTWLPGSHTMSTNIQLPYVPAGTYTLRLALLFPHNRQPAIRLANEGRDSDGWYSLSEVAVASTSR